VPGPASVQFSTRRLKTIEPPIDAMYAQTGAWATTLNVRSTSRMRSARGPTPYAITRAARFGA